MEGFFIQPAADIGGYQQMAPLLVLLLVVIPGVDTNDSTNSPQGVNLQIDTEVGRERGVIEQVIPDGNRLGFHLFNTHTHQKGNDANG